MQVLFSVSSYYCDFTYYAFVFAFKSALSAPSLEELLCIYFPSAEASPVLHTE
jgi:hypothetical protein